MKWSTFYAPPCVSVLSDDMPSGGSLVRLDRVREGAGGGGWYIPGGGGGSPWPDHKERQPDQRSVRSHCILSLSLDTQ